MNIQTALQELKLKKTDHPNKIHRAYRQLVKRWHPDQFAHRPEIHSLAEEKLKRINQAYALLNEYFNKSILNRNDINTKQPDKKTNPRTDEHSAPGAFSQMKVWFREAISKGFAKTPRPDGTDNTRKRSTSFTGVHQTGFEAVLRKACDSGKRRSVDTPRAANRSKPTIHRYRRRSRSTRIEGFHPTSPVTPVRPVRRIDPIEGSD